MRSFFEGDVQRASHSMDKIQNRRRPGRQYRLHHQPPTLVQHRHRNRVPVDIHANISHTIHPGVPFVALEVDCFVSATAAYSKGAPFYNAWPTQAVAHSSRGPLKPWPTQAVAHSSRGPLKPWPTQAVFWLE